MKNSLIKITNNSVERVSTDLRVLNEIVRSSVEDDVIKFFLSNSLFFQRLVSRHFKWNRELLSEFHDVLDWGEHGISKNPNIEWESEMIAEFNDSLKWVVFCWHTKNPSLIIEHPNCRGDGLSLNENVDWSVELIEKLRNKLDFDFLSDNPSLPWSFRLLEHFKSDLNWGGHAWSLSTNRGLPWSEELIDFYFDKWNWTELARNPGIIWTDSFIIKYQDKIKWSDLSRNPSLPCSIEFIENHIDDLDWDEFSTNEGIPWTLNLLKRYKNKWNKKKLLSNKSIIWSQRMLDELEISSDIDISPYNSSGMIWNFESFTQHAKEISLEVVFEHDTLWYQLFRPILTDDNIFQILKMIRIRTNFIPFHEYLQIDKDFLAFSQSGHSNSYLVVSQNDMNKIKSFFKLKWEKYLYFNSGQIIDDLENNIISYDDIIKMSEMPIPYDVFEILHRKVNIAAVNRIQDMGIRELIHSNTFNNHNEDEEFDAFDLNHEYGKFLLNKLRIPEYLVKNYSIS